MPYKIVKHNGKYCLMNKNTGTIRKGHCHDTKAKAQAQARAIMASEHGTKKR